MLGPINLAKLDQPVGSIELPGGRIVPVHEADGIVYRALEEMGQAVEEVMAGNPGAAEKLKERTLWELAARCLPSLSAGEVQELTPTECGIVLRMAQGRIKELMEAVEQAEGKAAGAGGAPSRETPSGSSVPASPTPAAPAPAPSS